MLCKKGERGETQKKKKKKSKKKEKKERKKAEFRGDRNIFVFIIFFCIQVHVACFNGRISYRLTSLSWPHPQSNTLTVIAFKIKKDQQRHK